MIVDFHHMRLTVLAFCQFLLLTVLIFFIASFITVFTCYIIPSTVCYLIFNRRFFSLSWRIILRVTVKVIKEEANFLLVLSLKHPYLLFALFLVILDYQCTEVKASSEWGTRLKLNTTGWWGFLLLLIDGRERLKIEVVCACLKEGRIFFSHSPRIQVS